jgi:hypothetical protein
MINKITYTGISLKMAQTTNRFRQQNYSNQSNGYRNFNSESRNQREGYNRSESRFRNKSEPPPKPDFKITENEFPDLAPTLEKTPEQSQKVAAMDFKAITLLEKPVIKTNEDVVNPGWVRLSFENGKNYGGIKWEYGDQEINWEQYEEEQYALEANKVMNEIIQRHENYRINYNNLFGEDAYEKLYGYRTSEYDSNDQDSEYYSSDDDQ